MTETVTQIGRINITGNVIPANWWRHIKMPSGKPDNIGIILLSEIIYWYRPAEIRDEFTGELQGLRKRFQSDKLQRSYQSFADQFGFTKREVTEAIKRLKSKGVITLEFRTINTANGPCNNVMFIEPVVESIHEITNSIPLINNQTKIETVSVIGPTSKRNRGYVEKEQPLRTEVIAPTSKRKTNTEITTENTTKITTENKTNASRQKMGEGQKSKFNPFLAKPENVSEEVWQDWVNFRKEIRKPLTETTCKQLAKKLSGCSDADAVLCNSIANGWQGVFPERMAQTKKPNSHAGFSGKQYGAQETPHWLVRGEND
ncbi:hypothetical protein [Providencia manganoxydans]